MKTLWYALSLASALLVCALGAASAAPEENPKVEMNVGKRGKIVMELYAKDAPKTVAHFLNLCKTKFYDGILFHRVIPGFVAQAGDPGSKKFKPEQLAGKSGEETGLGAGGSGKNIPFEVNKHTHETGTLAMALSAPRSATGDSQFFINLVPNHRLDGDYCVFGKVVKGADIVQKIIQGDKIVSMTLLKSGKKK